VKVRRAKSIVPTDADTPEFHAGSRVAWAEQTEPWKTEQVAKWRDEHGDGPFTVRCVAPLGERRLVYTLEISEIRRCYDAEATPRSPRHAGGCVLVRSYGTVGMSSAWFRPI